MSYTYAGTQRVRTVLRTCFFVCGHVRERVRSFMGAKGAEMLGF